MTEPRNSINPKELEIMAHTLGIDLNLAKRSKKAKDKKLPEKFYRNYFCTSVNHSDFPILDGLMRDRIMTTQERFGNLYFYVTEWGEFVFRNEFHKAMQNHK